MWLLTGRTADGLHVWMVDRENGEICNESVKWVHVSCDCWHGEWRELGRECEGIACVTWLLTGRTGRRVWRHCMCHLTVDKENWEESVKALHVSLDCWQGELGGKYESIACVTWLLTGSEGSACVTWLLTGRTGREGVKALLVSLDCWQGELGGKRDGIACVMWLLTGRVGRTGRRVWRTGCWRSVRTSKAWCTSMLTRTPERSVCFVQSAEAKPARAGIPTSSQGWRSYFTYSGPRAGMSIIVAS